MFTMSLQKMSQKIGRNSTPSPPQKISTANKSFVTTTLPNISYTLGCNINDTFKKLKSAIYNSSVY